MNSPREAAPPGTAATMKARHAPGGMSGKRATTPAKFWSRNKKIVALSAIFGIIIGIGITAAAGSSLYFTYQSQIDPFTASSSVELRNLNVVRDGDTLTATGVLKNTGQTSISRLWIDNLGVTNLVAYQSRSNSDDPTATSDDLVLVIQRTGNSTQFHCLAVNLPDRAPGSANANCPGAPSSASSFSGSPIATREFSGISMYRASGGQNLESVLEGGRTQAFKVVITCDGPSATPPTGHICDVLDISRDVAISDRLTITFGYASGDDILVSDAYSARVRSG